MLMHHPHRASELARSVDLRVARRIREQRLRIGVTRQKLAELIGVAFQQVQKRARPQPRLGRRQIVQN